MVGSALASGRAFKVAVIGLFFWALSYSWIPFALTDSEMGPLIWLPIVTKLAALVMGAIGIWLSLGARRHFPSRPDHLTATRTLLLSLAIVALVVVPNVLGALFLRR